VADTVPAGTDVASEAAPELEIVGDLVRRALPVAPILVAVSALVWGIDGALSSVFGIALVLLNFLLAAALMAWSARISPVVLGATVLGSYVVRLALVTVAVLLVKDQPWVNLWALCATIVVTHLGLLIWETTKVSGSLAYPGLKPKLTTLLATERRAASGDKE
jgi:hypothetical protein